LLEEPTFWTGCEFLAFDYLSIENLSFAPSFCGRRVRTACQCY